MTGEKKNRNKNEMLTLCIPYYHSMTHTGNACREGWSDI